jgi:Flp pilus assembly protein TadD
LSHPEMKLVTEPRSDVVEATTRARALELEGAFDEAARMLESFAQEPSPDPAVLYRLAAIRAHQDRLDEACDLLEQARLTDPRDAKVVTNLGVVYDLLGRTDDAIDAFRQVLRIIPEEPVALLNLGALYGELGRYEEAVRALTRCRERAPGFDVSFNLALVRSRQFEVQLAEALFAEAVRHDRSRAIGHYYLGRTQLKLGRSESAVRSLRSALGLEPELVRARFVLGKALNALSRYGEAAEELEAVTRALPDDPQAHYQLGIACDGLSQKARARECYRRSRTLSS